MEELEEADRYKHGKLSRELILPHLGELAIDPPIDLPVDNC